jgi:hypothetical protein
MPARRFKGSLEALTPRTTSMARTVEMFDKPPRATPRVMMHWDDAGADGKGHFTCKTCSYHSWYSDCSESDFRRGIPCPNCNPTDAPK